MALLLASGELCVCEITEALQLPQSTVSRHLSNLKNAGWLDDRREGVWIYYKLRDDGASSGVLKPLAAVLEEYLPVLPAVAADITRLGVVTARKPRCG